MKLMNHECKTLLIFQSSNNTERVIKTIETNRDDYVSEENREKDIARQIHEGIQKFLEEHNYKSYYTRVWNVIEKRTDGTIGNRTYYDVGSHTEFFISEEYISKEYI